MSLSNLLDCEAAEDQPDWHRVAKVWPELWAALARSLPELSAPELAVQVVEYVDWLKDQRLGGRVWPAGAIKAGER